MMSDSEATSVAPNTSEDKMVDESNSQDQMVDENIVDVLGDGGIIKKILRAAPDNETATPPDGAQVTVHYVGTLASNGKKFDSSRDREEPFKFNIGQGSVIKGWDEGVATMRKGELALFTLKPEYAYGKSGSPPSIPPNATLQFEVELLDFNDEEEVTSGITKKVLSEGEGWRKAEEDGATVVCSYKIYEKDNESRVLEQVDDLKFVFGDENVVSFVEDAIGSMKKNEKALFTITQVSPCQYLEYTSHTQEFKNNFSNLLTSKPVLKMEAHLKDIDNEKNSWEMSHEEKLNSAESKKEQGNELFKNKRFNLAQKRYERGLSLIEDQHPSDEPEEQKKRRNQILTSIYNNLSAIYLKQEQFSQAVNKCDKALEIDNQSIKSYSRKAQALQSLGELEEAKATLERCLNVCGNTTSETQLQLLDLVKSQLTKVSKALSEQQKKEKAMFSKMFQ
ncbi:hypothetical protein C9374_004856 [Naegleria lovaniensis]|uniref:peptidylprolyl isomerase n=1 Tax=Naegleria lovaniensis TaxID=51637 RepID=A0AA88GL16_NAELO|nr:uncharacterized protein C9374_004856 [Naegleria lovaniensis]KAG2382889.1 hypothetical protein C9374_004856 [Naegleria lovaniensis]